MYLFDASSLADDLEPIYTPPPSATHTSKKPIAHPCTEECSYAIKVTTHEIKDQFSLDCGLPKNSSNASSFKITQPSKKSDIEKHQGQIIFQNSIPQYSGHNMKPEDHYTSDLSIPSVYSDEYSSGGGVCELNDFNGSAYNSLCDATSDYLSESANYSYPDTPFNSIVHVAKDLKIYEFDDEENSQADQHFSVPIKIPKRTFDESAPIISGGASIIDFGPNKCESPAVRRRTDACPILSGGSVDLEEIEVKPVNKPSNNSVTSWVVDFNELKTDMDHKKSKAIADTSSVSTLQKNSLGFYVDFNDNKTPEDEGKILLAKNAPVAGRRQKSLDEKLRKKSMGFFVDFSDSDASCSDTPKLEHNIVKPKQSSEKKGSISMFIDFGQEPLSYDSRLDYSLAKENSSCDSSQEKKGCYMFIENESSIIMKRSLPNHLPKSEIKRHSWNTSETIDDEQMVFRKKHYQRSTSVTNEKSTGIVNVMEKILSKTASLNNEFSLSPFEDISCSKSLSSYSTTSGTISSDDDGLKISVPRNDGVMIQSAKRKQKDAKINETFDKSSQGSDVTDGVLSPDDSPISAATDTDDVTFQNPTDNNIEIEVLQVDDANSFVKSTNSVKMETIPESAESPFKTIGQKDDDKRVEAVIALKTLQKTVEEQMLLLESLSENAESQSFVKLSDLDKPVKFELHTTANGQYMSSSTNSRVARMFNEPTQVANRSQYLYDRNSWNMSRSNPGNNVVNNLASSVENSKSLSRLFPHLSKGIKNNFYLESLKYGNHLFVHSF